MTTPIQVPAESDTADAPTLSIVGVDPELGFAGGETQVLGLTLALAARRSSRGADLRSRGTALGAGERRGHKVSSAAHPQRDRPGRGRQAARDSQTRALRRRSFSYFAGAFDGAVRARFRAAR